MGPRISIGMPCYNSERWISPAIESLLAQTFEDFELIVIDNGSTDGGAEFFESVGAKVIRMPLLSDTMTEGKIVAWNKKVGDFVKSDDVLADVETDKATMEVVG